VLATISIDMIEDGQRLRELDEGTVAALVDSIADVGLLNPITVYPRKLYRGGNQVDGYGLVAGLHRKTACERLGLTDIDANIVDIGDLERQIAECDENLCAPKLTASERARFTKRRKEAYEALHPETRHGGNLEGAGVANLAAPETPAFAAATAAATGKSERAVQRDAERGRKVIDEALDIIKGTKLDTGLYLDKLKRLTPSEQVHAAKRDLANVRRLEREEAEKVRKKKAAQDVRARAAQQIAGWIEEKAGQDDLDFLISNLDAAGASNIAHALTELARVS
jgi:ParB family transcriptional regulator, chromosome partitioning protein